MKMASMFTVCNAKNTLARWCRGDGRAAECSGLQNRRWVLPHSSGGSNPSLPARFSKIPRSGYRPWSRKEAQDASDLDPRDNGRWNVRYRSRDGSGRIRAFGAVKALSYTLRGLLYIKIHLDGNMMLDAIKAT